jgi:hypothetical protein
MARFSAFRLLLGFVCYFTSTLVLAAPITVHFTAIVDRPRQGVSAPVPPSWNIDLQQGDTISGFFTLEPFDAPPNAYEVYRVEQSNLTLQIKSQTVITSQFHARATNDVTGDDIEIPYDSINVGCSFDECRPATVPHTSLLDWAVGIYAYGPTSVLDGPDIPANPNVWQQFDFNEILVSFSNRQNQFYGFLAKVNFIAVPEPQTAVLVVLGVSVFCRLRTSRLRPKTFQ